MKITEEDRERRRNQMKELGNLRKGCIPWNKDKHDIIPWNKGVKGYSTSWKGKYHSKETKNKMKGRRGNIKVSDEDRLRRSNFAKSKLKKINIGRIPWNKNVVGYHCKGGWNHKQEVKRKMSETRLRKIKSGDIKIIRPKQDTSIEIKIQNFLKQLGINFFTHQQMKINHSYRCDILIPSLDLVIECDGNYWHKYPIGNDIDKIRTSELIEKGFKVLRLWECEIKSMDLNKFQDKLKDIR